MIEVFDPSIKMSQVSPFSRLWQFSLPHLACKKNLGPVHALSMGEENISTLQLNQVRPYKVQRLIN